MDHICGFSLLQVLMVVLGIWLQLLLYTISKGHINLLCVDANHRELAELKGLLIEPSPSHMTHVSSPLGDTLDLDTFVELWAAEGISFGLADASCQPKTTIGSGCSIVSTCEQNELPLPYVSQLYSVKLVLALPDPKKQTTDLVVDKEINKVDPRNILIEGGKCFDELKVLRLKVEQLLRENTKLHAEALAYRVKRDHFRDSNARYLRITRTYCGNFDRIEAGDAIHDPDGTLALPAGYDGQIGGM